MSDIQVSGSVTELFCLQQQERIEQLTTETTDLLQKHEEVEKRITALEKIIEPATGTTAVRDCLVAAFIAEKGGRPFNSHLMYAPRVSMQPTGSSLRQMWLSLTAEIPHTGMDRSLSR